MATYFLLVEAGVQYFDDNGDPLSGGKLTTYEAGTTTSKTTYKDNAGGSSHANPIVLDSAGRIPSGDGVWGTTGDYKLKLDDSSDVNLWTVDDVTGMNDTGTVTTSEWITYTPTATQASATTFTIAGDQTSEFHVGRRLQIEDSATLYATITATSYSDPNTTVTVVVDGGTDLSSSMNGTSNVAYGVLSADNSSAPGGQNKTVIATTSGSSHSFTGIPSWATEVTMTLVGCSLDGTNNLLVQIGDEDGLETSAYNFTVGDATANLSANTNGSGFRLNYDTTAGNAWHGKIIVSLHDPATYTWAASWNLGDGVNALSVGAGSKALSKPLDRIALVASSGAFDAGGVNISYR